MVAVYLLSRKVQTWRVKRAYEKIIKDLGSKDATAPADAAAPVNGTPVYSPFQGKTELVEINVSTGDSVTKGQVVAAVEAMKAKHDVKAPCEGTVLSIDAGIGADIEAGKSIMTIGA